MSTSQVTLSSILFAEKYDRHLAEQWFVENRSILYQSMALYLVFVFVTKHYLKERKAFELRIPLAIWNAFLALFSTVGFLRMLPAFFTSFQNHGFTDTYSTYTEIQADACGYWMLLWRLSKIPEYVDTAFLVLRKREVSLMHLWHHISTSMCVFFVWEPYSEYNGLINYFIHGIMYTYFSLSTLGFILPAQFAQFITSIQLIQFFASEFIYSHVAILSLLSPTININFLPWLLSLITVTSQMIFWIGFYKVHYYQDGGRKYSKYIQKISVAQMSIAKKD